MKIRMTGLVCAWIAAGVAAGQTAPATAPAAPATTPAPARAQSTAPSAGGTVRSGQIAVRSTGVPQRDNVAKMLARATVEFNETRLEEVMRWIVTTSGVDMDVLWMDDSMTTGLDKEAMVTGKFENRPILDILEAVLERFGDTSGSGGGATWQMTQTGAMQVSTRDRLNRYKRVEVYPIRDLLMEIPNWPNAYELDLQQALQQAGQQGGAAQSPFTQNQQGTEEERQNIRDKADEIIDILTQLVEPDQWQQNGGEAGSMRYFQGALLVNAPDYMHRGINGYPWWPKSALRVSQQGTRRYVTLSTDQGLSTLERIENQPVTGTTGGGDLIPGGGG